MRDAARLADAIERMVDAKDARARRTTATKSTATVEGIDAAGGVWVTLPGADSPTPAKASAVEVAEGDTVQVTVGDGRVTVDANLTNPSAGLSGVQAADAKAEAAASDAKKAIDYAEQASTAASLAQDSADAAGRSANVANAAAGAAQRDAATASAAAASAVEDAALAHDAADAAQASADAAQSDATRANTYANAALDQLAFVEDVAGTLAWISEHGSFALTTDTAIVDGKVYFAYDSQSGDYAPVIDPQASELSAYYELDVTDSQAEFVMSHLAVTSRGLWVLPSGVGSGATVDSDVDKASASDTTAEKQANANARCGSDYKVLLASDGMYVYDGSGVQVAFYGESIDFSSGRQWHIGSNDAYILYTPASGSTAARLTIGGSNIRLGDSRTLGELLAEVDGTIVFKVSEAYSADNATATLTAHVYSGGEDIAAQYADSCFAWFSKTETGAALVPLPSPYTNGRTVTVRRADVGYGAAIVCRFTPPNDSVLLDDDDDVLTDSDDGPLAARTPSGDYTRVADLTVETTVFDTDKVLVVGSEDEHLVTIGTLKDVFGDGDYERLSSQPSIEGVTLIDNKDFPDLGIFKTDTQGYDVPDDYTLSTTDINIIWANAIPIGA